jgi:hypothetical protein
VSIGWIKSVARYRESQSVAIMRKARLDAMVATEPPNQSTEPSRIPAHVVCCTA